MLLALLFGHIIVKLKLKIDIGYKRIINNSLLAYSYMLKRNY